MDSIRKRNTASGFTLIELVVVVIIVGVLVAASLPVYRGYLRRTSLSEGRSVAGAIAISQKVYYVQNNNVLSTGTVVAPLGASGGLGIDVSNHKFFNSFAVPTIAGGPGSGSSYTAYIFGAPAESYASGITITLIQTMNTFPTITDNL